MVPSSSTARTDRGSPCLRHVALQDTAPHHLAGHVAYAIPGLSNLWLIATKDTALLAVVGFSELTLVTRQAAGSTKAYMLFYCAAGVMYLTLRWFRTASSPISKNAQGAALRGLCEMSETKITMPAYVPPPPRRLLEPHRIFLLAVFAGIVFCAIWFLRWDWLPKYQWKLLHGIWETLFLLFSTAAVGFLLAIGLGLVQVTGPRPLAWLARGFCTLIRGTPLLLQLWLLYYGLGSVFAQYPEIRQSMFWPYLRQAWPYGFTA